LKYKILHTLILPLAGLFWRFNRLLSFVKFYFKYRNEYFVSIFKPGNGLHFKFLLRSKLDKNKSFLVKTTSFFPEFWENILFNWKVEVGITCPYGGRLFPAVIEGIELVNADLELKKMTLLFGLNTYSREIWYVYESAAVTVSESDCKDSIKQYKKIIEIFKGKNLIFIDDHEENALVINMNVKLIDLESLLIRR